MNPIRYTLRTLLFAVALVVSLLVAPATARAASDYDDAYRTASTIALGSNGWSPYYTACAREDYSASWMSAMLSAPQMTTAYANSFNEALENGRWGVSSAVWTYSSTHPIEGFIVYWTEDTSLRLEWGEGYDGHLVWAEGGSSFHSVVVQNHNAATTGSDCSPHAFLNAGRMVSSSTDTINNPEDSRNWFINTDHPNYPTGYEGMSIRTESPAAEYVAMGDSYASGEGNDPFEFGTDVSSNTCHRSPVAWPRLLQNDPGLDLGTTAFVACSGAVSDYIINDYNQENVEVPQALYVSDATKLVTISIGGNDIGFGNVLLTCTMATKEEGTTSEKHEIEHDACIDAIDDARDAAASSTFQDDLEAVFSGLRELGDEDLEVVVTGYPNLLPGYSNIVGSCVWGNGQPTTSGRAVSSDETQKSRLLHDELNATIEAAVDATSDTNIHFVDPSSAFAGHELCRPSPWFNNVVADWLDEVMRRMSYHPNSDGQAAYKSVVGTEVDNLFP